MSLDGEVESYGEVYESEESRGHDSQEDGKHVADEGHVDDQDFEDGGRQEYEDHEGHGRESDVDAGREDGYEDEDEDVESSSGDESGEESLDDSDFLSLEGGEEVSIGELREAWNDKLDSRRKVEGYIHALGDIESQYAKSLEDALLYKKNADLMRGMFEKTFGDDALRELSGDSSDTVTRKRELRDFKRKLLDISKEADSAVDKEKGNVLEASDQRLRSLRKVAELDFRSRNSRYKSDKVFQDDVRKVDEYLQRVIPNTPEGYLRDNFQPEIFEMANKARLYDEGGRKMAGVKIKRSVKRGSDSRGSAPSGSSGRVRSGKGSSSRRDGGFKSASEIFTADTSRAVEGIFGSLNRDLVSRTYRRG